MRENAIRFFIFSSFLTLVILAWGESARRNSAEGPPPANKEHALGLLKLKREAMRDDSIDWGDRVEAWVEANGIELPEETDLAVARAAPKPPQPVAVGPL